MIKSDRSSYTALDFQGWAETGGLVISPKFQRRGVWSRAARSFLIDTMLLNMPVPPIYLRVVQDKSRERTVREIVDGQQRISAVLDFLSGKFTLSKNIESDCVGKKFSDLNDDQQDRIRNYSFICEVFSGIEDADVLRVFARLNIHSVKLNAQELRNGKFFGSFKQSAYALALEHLEFWRLHRIFTEMRIARMAEVELTSELMILQLSGLQDKKSSISSFYEEFDDEFPNKSDVENKFRNVIDAINNSCSGSLVTSEFRRPPLFYSLYAAVFHRMYGLSNVTLDSPKRGRMTNKDIEGLSDAILQLSDYVVREREEETVPKHFKSFVTACLRQTDNIRPRRTRTETIYKTAFG